MKKYLLCIVVFFSFSTVKSQSEIITDSLLREICNTIKSSTETNDSIKIVSAISTHLSALNYNHADTEVTNKIGDYIFFRLQKFCKEFKDYLDKIYPPKDNYKEVYEKPTSKLDKVACAEFLQIKDFYYLEDSGDTTRVTLDGNYWIDNFNDSTYSKLTFRWIDSCEFEIEFVESNNWVKKNLSNPGDKYRYRILQKHEDYYDIALEIVGLNRFFVFKMYYNR